MPISGFNVGRDTTIVISHPMAPGGELDIPIIESFDPKPLTAKLASHALDGTNRFGAVPQGWTGTIAYDRASSVVDDFFDTIEKAFYAGITVPLGTITEYNTETSGANTTYLYSNVSFDFADAGKRQGDAIVKGMINWSASRREKQ